MLHHIWEDTKRVQKRLIRQFNVIKTTSYAEKNLDLGSVKRL